MIQKNIPQKLSGAALAYQCIGSFLLLAFLSIFAVTFAPAYSQYISSVFAMAIVAVIIYVFTFLYWKFFEYTVTDSSIVIRSGVITMDEKSVNFNDIQNAQVKYGPLTALCGVKRVVAFTASPAQLEIVSSGRSTSTVMKPDVSIVLLKDDAEELLQMMKRGDVQKVETVEEPK